MSRIAEILHKEAGEPLQWFYLSFAGEEGFRGAIIVEARGITSAVMRCNLLGINPHGEVLGVPVGQHISKVPDDARDRLLSRAELEMIFTDLQSLKEMEGE